MKRTEVLQKLSPGTRKQLLALKRRGIYLLEDHNEYSKRKLNCDGYLVQVTHFHKKALRCKVLALPGPMKKKRTQSLEITRILQKRAEANLDFSKPFDPFNISILYTNVGEMSFKELPIDQLPLYINKATTLYGRYIEELRRNLYKEVSHETQGKSETHRKDP